ncbi:MAG: response regulator transcription factor [Pseudomonadota bacterium]
MTVQESPIRVLVVDDHQTMLWGLSRLIDGERPRMAVVGAARSGDEALEKAVTLQPNTVLLDLDLQTQCGLDFIGPLLERTQARVLVLTGERKQTTLDTAIQRGACGILRKDSPPDQVIKAIEKTHEGELWLDRETMGRVLSGVFGPGARKANLDPEAERRESLTSREKKIIEMIVEGRGALNKTLAERLYISEHTLRNHLTSIYHKLGVGNRLELYVYALKHQLGTSA